MSQQITDDQWTQFEEEGYLRLGKVMDDDELAGLQQRINDIMLGKVKVYDQMYMQLDSNTGDYSEKRTTTKRARGFDAELPKNPGPGVRSPVPVVHAETPFLGDLCEGLRPRYSDFLLSGHVYEQACREGHTPPLAPGSV